MMPARPSEMQPGKPPARPTRLDALGDQIAELSAHIDAATYRLLVLIREFDEREGWHDGMASGFRSCAHWLNWRTGVALGAAREKVRVARALGELPEMSAAMERGELSYSKVRALTRVATPENEAELLVIARAGTAAHVETMVRLWRRVDRLAGENERQQEELRHASRSLSLYPGEDGMWVLRGRLPAEVGALLEKALEMASEEMWRRGDVSAERSRPEEREGGEGVPAVTPTHGQRMADAVGLVAEMALGGCDGAAATAIEAETLVGEEALGRPRTEPSLEEGDPGQGSQSRGGSVDPSDVVAKPGHGSGKRPEISKKRGGNGRFEVVVHVDAEALAKGSVTGQSVLEQGLRVPAETSRRLSCDCGVRTLVHDKQGRTLDAGRRTRTVPPALRRALEHRDRTCRFPGCESRHCDAHHIEHWADGGKTKLSNLVLLCRRHHRAVHEEGWSVALERGELEFQTPGGRRVPEAPPRPPVKRPVRTMRALHAPLGFEINAETALPSWAGERVDWAGVDFGAYSR